MKKFFVLCITLIVPMVVAWGQNTTWPPANYHKGEIYIDPILNNPNSFDAADLAFLKAQIVAYKATSGNDINIMFFGEDCRNKVSWEYTVVNSERKYKLDGPLFTSQSGTTSNVWAVEDKVSVIYCFTYGIAPFPSEYLDWDRFYAGNTSPEAEFSNNIYDLLSKDPKSQLPFGKRSVKVVNDIMAEMVKLESTNTSTYTPNLNYFDAVQSVVPLKSLKYDHTTQSYEPITDKDYGEFYRTHLKSAFCEDVQLVEFTPISYYAKKTAWKSLLEKRLNRGNFLVFGTHRLDDASRRLEIINVGNSNLNAPTPLACYPQGNSLSNDDIKVIQEEVDALVSSGRDIKDQLKAAGLKVHNYLAFGDEQPSILSCTGGGSIGSPNTSSVVATSTLFGTQYATYSNPNALNGAYNENNTVPISYANGKLLDYSGGLSEAEVHKYEEAIQHAEELTEGGVHLETKFIWSAEDNAMNNKPSLSRDAAYEKFLEEKAAIENSNERKIVFYHHYDKVNQETYFLHAASKGYYAPKPGMGVTAEQLKPGMDSILIKVQKEMLEDSETSENFSKDVVATPEFSELIDAAELWDIGIQGKNGSKVIVEVAYAGTHFLWKGELPTGVWDPSSDKNYSIKMPGSIAGASEGIYEAASGLPFAIIGGANFLAEVVKKPSRTPMVAAFRYPHIAVAMMYANDINGLAVAKNSEQKWYHGSKLAIRTVNIFINPTAVGYNGFTKGLSSDIGKMKADFAKMHSVFTPTNSAGYSLGMRSMSTDPNNPRPANKEHQEILMAKVSQIGTHAIKLMDHSQEMFNFVHHFYNPTSGKFDRIAGISEAYFVNFFIKFPDLTTNPKWFSKFDDILSTKTGIAKEKFMENLVKDNFDPKTLNNIFTKESYLEKYASISYMKYARKDEKTLDKLVSGTWKIHDAFEVETTGFLKNELFTSSNFTIFEQVTVNAKIKKCVSCPFENIVIKLDNVVHDATTGNLMFVDAKHRIGNNAQPSDFTYVQYENSYNFKQSDIANHDIVDPIPISIQGDRVYGLEEILPYAAGSSPSVTLNQGVVYPALANRGNPNAFPQILSIKMKTNK